MQSERGITKEASPRRTLSSSVSDEFELVEADTREALRLPPHLAALVSIEAGLPVRGIPSYKGQRHLPGRYWFATTARHVRYEGSSR